MARPKYIQIFGERNSGTNYLHFLLEENISNIKVGYKFGWKHGFAKKAMTPEKVNDETLIICLFKDPYSWLVSMQNKPHHAPQLKGLAFSDFIKSEWACYEGDNYDKRNLENDPIKAEQEMMFERNPETGERFDNIIKLRSAKIKALRKLEELWPNTLFMTYEQLLAKPKVTVCKIAGEKKLKLAGPVKLSKGYFGKNPNKSWDRKAYYDEKRYLDIYTEEDLQFVNSQIDFEQESFLGYQKIESLYERS